MRPTPLLISHYHKPKSPNPNRMDERNSSRSELRDTFDGQLVRKTGRSDAKMWYTLYARRVVSDLGFKLNDNPGWPSDIPFRDLNRIPGGAKVFKRLLSLCHSGQLRFVKATEEDRRNALLDPRLLIPNLAQRAAALASSIPHAPAKKLVHRITDLASRFQLTTVPSPPTTGTVLHPATMDSHFTFSVLSDGAQNATGTSEASRKRPPKRAQRSDINKSRKRPVTNPEGCELRHPKRGPLTARCIVEAEGIVANEVEEAIESRWIVLTDENLRDCTEVRRGAGSSPNGSLEDLEMAGLEEDIESADDSEWD